jgi:hypothetical protein
MMRQGNLLIPLLLVLASLNKQIAAELITYKHGKVSGSFCQHAN